MKKAKYDVVGVRGKAGNKVRGRIVFRWLTWGMAAAAIVVFVVSFRTPDGFGVQYTSDGPQDWRLVIGTLCLFAALGCHRLAVGRPSRKPLPPVTALLRQAVVTGRQRVSLDGYSDYELVAVRVDHPDGVRTALIADLIAEESFAMFPVGSQWTVHCFERDNGRVVLSRAHDDVPRHGYQLDGVASPSSGEAYYEHPARPGSFLLPKQWDDAKDRIEITSKR